MYICMYVRTYVRMYVCMYVCIYVCMYVRTYVCMYVLFYMVYCLFHYNGNTTSFAIILVDMLQLFGFSAFSLSNCLSLIKFVNSL